MTARVTRSTVYRTLVRNGLIEPASRRRSRKDYRRWERGTAMELWQLDVTASAFLAIGAEAKIVTGVDDHSRFCVIATALMRATARPVCGVRHRDSGSTRPACTSYPTAPGSRPCPPGSASQNWQGSLPAAPGPPGPRLCLPATPP